LAVCDSVLSEAVFSLRLRSLRNEHERCCSTTRPWEIIGLVVVVLVILVAVFSNKSDDKPTPTPIADNGRVSNAIAPANVETTSHVESHDLKVSPNYFGGNPISDGRTYSVALICVI
jgi:hypothetical protein